MILLNSLQVENFKSLRHVDLCFPQRGSVLIEGLNEAGKSTLFESIYFALYGKPLECNLDDCLRYGTDTTLVRLVLEVDGTRLEIQRTLRRDRPNQASLIVQRPGAEPETVQAVRAVNARIVAELGKLDGDALLNSCFVEQKKLSKLEDLGPDKRRESLLRLLNLEKLGELEEVFKITRADETALSLAARRRELAETQQKLPELENDKANVERLLQALGVRRDLGTLVDLRQMLAELVVTAERLQGERLAVEERLQLVEHLRQAAAGAQRIIGHYGALAPAERRRDQLRTAITALDRKEAEELPAAERHHEELLTLVGRLDQWEGQQRRREEVTTRLRELAALEDARARLRADRVRREDDRTQRQEEGQQVEADLAQLAEEERVLLPEGEDARNALDGLIRRLEALQVEQNRRAEQEQARQRLQERLEEGERLQRRLAGLEEESLATEDTIGSLRQRAETWRRLGRQLQVADALREWLRLRRSADALAAGESASQQEEAQAGELHRQWEQVNRERKVAASRVRAFGALGGLAIMAAAGAALGSLLVLALPLVLAAFALGVLSWQARTSASRWQEKATLAQAELSQQEQLAGRRHAELEAARRLGGSAADLARCEEELASLDQTVPATAEAGERLLRELNTVLAGKERAAVLAEGRQVEQSLARAEATQRSLLSNMEELRGQVAAADVVGVKQALATKDLELSKLGSQFKAEHEAIQQELDGRGLPADIERVRAARDKVLDDLAALRTRLARRSEVERQLESVRSQIAAWSTRLVEIEGELNQHQDEALAEQTARLFEQEHSLATEVERQRDELARLAGGYAIPPQSGAARELAGRVASEIEGLRREIQSRPTLVDELGQNEAAITEHHRHIESEAQALAALSLGGLAMPSSEDEVEFRSFLEQATLRREALEPGLRQELARLDGELGRTREREHVGREQQVTLESGVQNTLFALGATPPFTLDLLSVESACPPVVEAADWNEAELKEQSDNLLGEIGTLRRRRAELERVLGLVGVAMDLQECREDEKRQARNLEVKRRAVRIVTGARTQMVAKVLPNTERNLRFLLPLLTADRYHDARITEDYRIEVWDETANGYVAKSIFSGGTRDQFSLALRLAFALATLPQELGTTPGFVFLDEPLSSFDSQRAQALVDLLTNGHIAANFMQIFVISHSRSFDPAVFPYHLRLEAGQVAESDLPRPANAD